MALARFVPVPASQLALSQRVQVKMVQEVGACMVLGSTPAAWSGLG